jgi:tetratricopeptide (TPR) repeat protein
LDEKMNKSDEVDERKICFVAMGFGKKTDYENQRTLDLDETYDEIIKPAIEAAGMRPIRANEIKHSGIIDVKMYEMLLRADLVIADISTANPNAIYELGVRHALRPFSTIVIKEEAGRFHFDLNHLATLTYKHLGEEIGAKEARRASDALKNIILEVMKNPKPDSPVYTFLPMLAQPKLSEEEFAKLVDMTEAAGEHLSDIIERAKIAASESKHEEAAKLFGAAAELTADNSYLLQQKSLHTYKSAFPSEFLALTDALTIIQSLEPDTSNDPETLGIAGAIYQRLWKIANDPEALDRPIALYERGFVLRGDYYNGENAATCLEQRSIIQTKSSEALFDRMSASKIRVALVNTLQDATQNVDFGERNDKKWVFATLANCLTSIGNVDDAKKYERKFLNEKPSDWEVESFNRGIALMHDYLEKSK